MKRLLSRMVVIAAVAGLIVLLWVSTCTNPATVAVWKPTSAACSRMWSTTVRATV